MFDINANDTLEAMKPFAQWLHEHVLIAGLLTCFISFVESLAIVGYLVPGSILMPAIGILVGAGILPAADIFLWAILGAILGDGLSFWLGRHYHESLRDMWPMRNFPSLLQRTEVFFEKHGGKSVFIGRFVGAVRPMIPVVAGMMNMSPWRFYTANIASALIWAPAFLLPGVILGAASLELPAKLATKFLIILFICFIALWVLVWFLQRGIHRSRQLMIAVLNRTWVFLHRHPSVKPLCKLMRDPTQPYKHGQFSLTLLFIIAGGGLWWLLTLPLGEPAEIPINSAIDYLFKGLRNPLVDTIAACFSLLADKKVLLVPVVSCTAWLCWRKQWIPAIHLIGIYFVTAICIALLKHGIAAPRPPEIGNGNILSHGFPSGHSTLAVTIYGFLLLLFTRHWARSWKKTSVYLLMILFVITSITTRLYLGAHWFTDVLGGFCLGMMILSATALSFRRYPLQKYSSQQLRLVTSASLIMALLFVGFSNQHLVSRYAFHPDKQELTAEQWWQTTESPAVLLRNRVGRVESAIDIQWLGELSNIEATLTGLDWQPLPTQTWLDYLNRFNPDLDKTPLPMIAKQYKHQNPALIMMKPASAQMPTQLIYLWQSPFEVTDSQQKIWFAKIVFYIPTHQAILKRQKPLHPQTPAGLTELKQALPAEQQRLVRTKPVQTHLIKRGLNQPILFIQSRT